MSEWKETDFGSIPEDWEISTLGQICDLITDGSHSSPKPVVSSYFMASVKDMRYNYFDFSDCKTISKNDFETLDNGNCSPQKSDILLSKDGANCLDLIFVYKQTQKIVLLSSIAIARLKKGFDPDFYRFFLLSPNVQFLMRNNFVSGSAIPRVVLKDFRNVPVPIIPIQKQIDIASVLTSLDDKIDLLHRQNATLEAMAETLFRQWFVEEANTASLSQLVYIQNGYAFKSKDFKENGCNGVVKIKNISGGIIDIEKTDFIDERVAKSVQDRFQILTGDILIAMTGAEIGKLGIIPKTDKNLWLNQRVGLLKEKFTGSKYLAYQQLKSEFGQDYIENTATGSAQPNISGTGIENCGFPQLTENQIKEYSYQIGELYEKVIFNLGQIRTLTALRDTLLPKLMSGEVRVEM